MFLLKNIVVTAPADTINTVLTLDATDFLGVVAVGISAVSGETELSRVARLAKPACALRDEDSRYEEWFRFLLLSCRLLCFALMINLRSGRAADVAHMNIFLFDTCFLPVV